MWRYKKTYAEFARENYALKELQREKARRLPEKRQAAEYLVAERNLSKTKACEAVNSLRSSRYRSAPTATHEEQLIMDALNTPVERRPRWDFWMCFRRLRLMDHCWNNKRVYCVYKAMMVNLPRRIKQWLPVRFQQTMEVDARSNAEWSIDFKSDTLYRGRRLRTLKILDAGLREAVDMSSTDRSRAVALSVPWFGCSSGVVTTRQSASTVDLSTCRRSSPTGARRMRSSMGTS